MPIFTVTTSPVQIDDGTDKAIDITNTGTVRVTLSTGDVLKPGQAKTICPSAAVTATASPLSSQVNWYGEVNVQADSTFDAVLGANVSHDNASYLPQAAGTKGTLTVNGTPDSASGWGLVIDKNSAGRVGSDSGSIVWSVAGVRKWDIGMDVSDVQMALLYDYTGSGVVGATSGDLIRVAPGGYFLIARSAGPASPSWRLQINTDNKDDPSMTGVLKLARGAGSPATLLLLGHDDDLAADIFTIDHTGKASFGAASSGRSASAYLEAKGGLVAYVPGASGDPFLMLAQEDGANAATYVLGVDHSSGVCYLKDNGTSNWPFQIVKSAANTSLHIMSGGVINFGAAPTTTTAPGAGGAGALPATPTGYFTLAIGGTQRKVAYY